MAAAVHVRDGRIVTVAGYDDVPTDMTVVELGGLAVLPGFVDSHVHINEPGRTDWEGFETATRAAAAGGVTTLVDMPLNSVPATTSVAALEAKLHAAEGKLAVDVAFWAGVIPGNTAELPALHTAGVAGFKCFLVPSGVPEFPHVSYGEMEAAMRVLAPLDVPLLVHAEDPGVIEAARASFTRSSCAGYAATRPAAAEVEAIRKVAEAAERAGARCHIVHVAAADALTTISRARNTGVRISIETCPHYLWFTAADAPAGGVAWKCAPPIRDAANRDRLRAALAQGEFDLVASDHSPAPASVKLLDEGDFVSAWGGVASLQIAPLVTWTVAQAHGCTLVDLARLVSTAPAKLAGLDGRKGAIAPGFDADFAVLDDNGQTVVEAARLLHRHPITPYEGATLCGRIVQTWLRGRQIYGDDRVLNTRRGRALLTPR